MAEQQDNVIAIRANDRRPLRSGLAGTCRAAHRGEGLPAGTTVPTQFTGDLVRIVDAFNRTAEREERLLEMNGENVSVTLVDACRAGGVSDARFLLEHGADVDYEGEDGWTALVHAAHEGFAAVVEVLVDAGAADMGEVACFWANFGGHSDTAALLPFDPAYDMEAALFDAAIRGHVDMAMRIVRTGFNIEIELDGLPLAFQAAGRGHLALLEALLDTGNVSADDMSWAVMGAAKARPSSFAHEFHGPVQPLEAYTACLALLIERGADPDGPANNTLETAVEDGFLPIVKVLLDGGATDFHPGQLVASAVDRYDAIAELLRAHYGL